MKMQNAVKSIPVNVQVSPDLWSKKQGKTKCICFFQAMIALCYIVLLISVHLSEAGKIQ